MMAMAALTRQRSPSPFEGANDAPVVIDPNDPFPNPNDPPVPTDPDNVIPDQSAEDASPLTPLDISPFFVDVDGEPLTFGFDPLDPDVPSWISIDPVTGVITGTPPSDASIGGPNGDGVYPLTVTATDPDGETVTTTVDFTITNPPPVTTGLPDQTDTAGESFIFPTAGSFNDPDGDTLTYTVSGLPGGLTIDPVTGEISGMIDGNAVPNASDGNGTYMVTVTADDGQGGTVSTSFTFKVLDPVHSENPAPDEPAAKNSNDKGGGENPLEADLILDKAVNGISPLGGDTGLFDPDHPLTEALYQISPLSEGISLDAFGHPVTQTIEWIEKTRNALDRDSGGNAPYASIDYYSGGDTKVALDGTEYVLRTMAWDGLVYLEIIASDDDVVWEVDSINGASASGRAELYGSNLIAFHSPAGPSGNSVVLIGSDRNGNEIVLDLKLEMSGGQFEIDNLSVNRQAAGFSSQLYAISNQPLNEARALLQKSS